MKCKACGEEFDGEDLQPVKIRGKVARMCEECADRAQEEGEVESAALGAMKDMMGYKGKF